MGISGVEHIGRELLDKHLGKDVWKLNIVNGNPEEYLGKCKYHSKTIELNEWWMKRISSEDVIDVILHEIAHALDHIFRGPNREQSHDKQWRNWAKSIGCTGKEFYEINDTFLLSLVNE